MYVGSKIEPACYKLSYVHVHSFYSMEPADPLLRIQVAGDEAIRPLDCFSGRTHASSENILVRTVVFLDCG